MVLRRRQTDINPDTGDITLLIASSDRDNNRLLRDDLQAAGYTVLQANNAQQTLQMIYQERPHLLVIDQHLRGPRSDQICHTIKADETLGFVPVILLADPGWQGACHADALLDHATTTSELTEQVRTLLRVKQQVDGLLHEKNKLVAVKESLDRLKSEIIANVAHELRTPLLQVKSATSLLAEDLFIDGTHEQRRVADMALQAVARLEGVVENIRQLVQTHQLRLSPFEVKESVDLALRHLERSWESRDQRHRVEPHLEANLLPVMGDKRGTARLLQLMLDNALKFSPDDMPVYVRATQTGKDEVTIGVQDFGIGIAEEDYESIFEAFYQIDRSSTREHGGTGAGLALAKLLADGMQTVIHVDSVPGEGSTFWFTLPIATPNDYDHL
jgi:signal transduction histidine kinase